MREIKFRAWCDTCDSFVPILQLFPGDDGMTMFCPMHPPVVVAKIMQYTGLKDKNGVEIYEGDIFQKYQYKYIVRWSPRTAEWELFLGENEDGSYTTAGSSFYYAIQDLEVIGNIYENEELLK